jgi:hypothetical protein
MYNDIRYNTREDLILSDHLQVIASAHRNILIYEPFLSFIFSFHFFPEDDPVCQQVEGPTSEALDCILHVDLAPPSCGLTTIYVGIYLYNALIQGSFDLKPVYSPSPL